MNEAQWEKVKECFAVASELDSVEQRAYLEDLRETDAEVYREVISLLSAEKTNQILPQSSVNNIFMTQKSGEPHTVAHNINLSDAPTEATTPNEEDNKIIGQIIGGRYVIVRKLGSGGMGEVFLAHDRNVMNRESVVKMLRAETLGNREVTRKFQQEIEALARLKDSGIVTILDSGTHGKQPFLVLEYVEGEDLSLLTSPTLFSIGDFLEPLETARKLSVQEGEAQKEIWRRLSAEARRNLAAKVSVNQTAQILRDEFNRILTDATFSQTKILTPEATKEFIEKTAKLSEYNKIPSINRLILESCFPNEIVKGSEKRLPNAQAALIFRQLGASLAHGHAKGIIHRDLKPSNIMVTTSEGVPQTKLIDFGVAKVQESLVAPTTELGIAFGTRKYMSPEQINANPNLTPASDIYSLGLIAFEVLTGQNAFPTDNFIERCRWQETESYFDFGSFRPDLSPAVGHLITQSLAFNPARRPQNAAEFTAELADAIIGKPTESAIPEAENSTSPDGEETVITKVETTPSKVKSPVPVATQAAKKTGMGIWAMLGALALFSIIGLGGWLYWRNQQSNVAVTAISNEPRRELNYRLVVQKYYEGKPFQKPFEATGDEIFGDDWRFKMIVSSPQGGNLYLLTENPQTQNLTMLFPNPQKNNGISTVKAGEKIETGEMMFDKTQGVEKFWIVWTESPAAELEAVKSFVNPQDLGRIKDKGKEKVVRDFLAQSASNAIVTEKISDDKQSKTVYSTAPNLVKLTEFRHN